MLEPITTLFGHEEESRLWHVAWSNNGLYLASCGEDKVIRIWSSNEINWDKADGINCIATLEDGRSRTLRSCEWSPDDRMIASASFDGTVVIWEVQSSSMTVWDEVKATIILVCNLLLTIIAFTFSILTLYVYR
jgi:WD40 repeat protein